jgi:threonylcarbamoyladenosine tRNA methylthiotransferase MtaB
MKIALTAIGCRLNEAEIATWAREFQLAGHQVVSGPEEAELIIFNSCAVTTEAARKSRQWVKRLHRQNPQARIIATGCYATLEPQQLARIMGVEAVLNNTEKRSLVQQVAQWWPEARPISQPHPAPDTAYLYPGSRTRAFIKVQDGCRNRCTYCIVTLARGAEQSRSPQAIVDEINALHGAGYQEAVLTGVHLGGYGSDIGSTLYQLVQTLLTHTTIPRLRLSSLEPWDLPQHFFQLWQNPRLMPHLHLPLQSGSDIILRRMARHYTTAAFARLVENARAAIPNLNLTTDIIVGFPGETDDDWAQTVAFVQQMRFGHSHIFSYSQRTGTAAARLPGQHTGEVKRARSQQLHTIAARLKQETLARHVDSVQPVLWEGPGQPQHSGLVRWSGYTENYLRVLLDAPAGLDLENRILPVRIIDHTPEHLVAAAKRDED